MTAPPPSNAHATGPPWKVGGATIPTFGALLYVIELIAQLTGHSLDRNGIRPLETDWLKGHHLRAAAARRVEPPVRQHRTGAGGWCWVS